jgi:hypothetical protein
MFKFFKRKKRMVMEFNTKEEAVSYNTWYNKTCGIALSAKVKGNKVYHSFPKGYVEIAFKAVTEQKGFYTEKGVNKIYLV